MYGPAALAIGNPMLLSIEIAVRIGPGRANAIEIGQRIEVSYRSAIPIACAYANVRPLKFSVLNLISGLGWAGAIMLFVKGGSTTLSAFGLDTWWGPFIPALLVIVFFRWLSSRSRA